ncbi:MAG: hypothetical protein ABMA64_38830 [Myxococcota bacterium]
MVRSLRTWAAEAALVAVALPVLGLLMGGVLSYPVIRLTGGRDPWLTAGLAAALAVPTGVPGLVVGAPWALLGAAWTSAVGLLLVARWVQGDLAHGLERFGMVHAAALVGSGVATAVWLAP